MNYAASTLTPIPELSTNRLMLRSWRAADTGPFTKMNADPRVMEYYPAALNPMETRAMIARIEAHFAVHGFGLWAVELRSTGEFIGYIGLNIPTFEPPFKHTNPCVEIGWRLAYAHWGQGLAVEGARAVLEHAFGNFDLDEVVSFTVPSNFRSRRVMEKLGMVRDSAGDFEHPRIIEGHPLRRHVLYRMQAGNR